MIEVGPYTIYVPDSFEDELLNCDAVSDFDEYQGMYEPDEELEIRVQSHVARCLGIDMAHVKIYGPMFK